MLLVRICWGPARGRFAGSGGFEFRISNFEFPDWLRPTTNDLAHCARLRISCRSSFRSLTGFPCMLLARVELSIRSAK